VVARSNDRNWRAFVAWDMTPFYLFSSPCTRRSLPYHSLKNRPRPGLPELRHLEPRVRWAPRPREIPHQLLVSRPVTTASLPQRQTVKRNCGVQLIYYGFLQIEFKVVRTHNRSLLT